MEWRKDTYDIGRGEKTTETYTAPLIQRDETTNERKGTDFKNTDSQYQFGIFTFLDWVKEEYPEYQSDVDQALRILKEHEGKGNLNAKQLGDAGTYEKLLRTADLLERQNEVRVQDEIFPGRSKQWTNFSILAKAIVSANVSTDPAGGHRRTFRVFENLAWGLTDPFDGWYFREKEIYKSLLAQVENYKKENPSASEESPRALLKQLEEENRPKIGHYLNILNSEVGLVAIAENSIPGANRYGNTHAMNGDWGGGELRISEEEYRKIIEEDKNYKVVKEVRETKRVYGVDRVQTSTQISKRLVDTAEEVILAGSLAGADALSAGPLAVEKKGPITQVIKNELDGFVAEELERLGTRKVTLVGGEAAVSSEVEEALLNLGFK